jgi:hypothetical protein
MKPEAERILDLPNLTGREQIASDAGGSDGSGVVHLQVDKTREDERFLRSPLPRLDRDDGSGLENDRSGEATLDGVNEKSL